MPSSARNELNPGELKHSLSDPAAYPHPVEGPVTFRETHISLIVLAGPYAYKIKKACVTDFLDYGTLAARQAACELELRLNRRYAPDLYLSVVPIHRVGSGLCVGSGLSVAGSHRVGSGEGQRQEPAKEQGQEQGEVVEYAVQMHRFPDDALLKERLRQGRLAGGEIRQLAQTVADFHAAAAKANAGLPSPDAPWGSPPRAGGNALANFKVLRNAPLADFEPRLSALEQWTRDFLEAEAAQFWQRIAEGRIRECHGDLHLENVIQWHDRLLPFDGIEFNESFRWIDVLSDAAFLAMDFAACERFDLSHRFTNDYLELSGDREALQLWRWYLVYRALVRAKVAAMRADQPGLTEQERATMIDDCRAHIALAERFTRPEPRCLWITHGLSGSGKTTGSEWVVERCGAIRLRSDVERKRGLGLAPTERPDRQQAAEMYGEAGRQTIYDQLHRLARGVLRGGYSVVVDATFLMADQRQRFAELAKQEGVRFAILDFPADAATLRQRVAERQAAGDDASDAGLEVLEQQFANEEPLSAAERQRIETLPDL
ncbi:bifunctional aminoglycoside phosphotransferase/ATP-binding protein [Candidatus Laterigemmans baculatus]|uniref:bifunctional aminoglycoside phosphotransferase/ATP-binding protein n=1 Tax=Candidatus Laterigemmans baculatus TaxID=2770505 RepID=UPI0013D9247D|nr:bifunctional aminoglycoside phosphotransferase/ATP-binding protein [Candidatus Laterigemmans baculatus]